MHQLVSVLESHDKLAGWAQFFGAMIALILTYVTAFSPQWRRKKQLQNAGTRLLLNSYEALESYHRTSVHYPPTPLSIRMACLSFDAVSDEIDRFPVFELDSHGPNSLARRLLAASATLKASTFTLEFIASDIEKRVETDDDRDDIRSFIGDRLDFIKDLITGAELKRPVWTAPNQTQT